MQYNVKSIRLKLQPKDHEYIEKKFLALEKLITHFGSDVKVWIEVELLSRHHRSGEVYQADFQIHVPGKRLVATAKGETVLAALDAAKDKMQKELRAYKSKKTETKRTTGRALKERGA